jgi:hypothetical protein
MPASTTCTSLGSLANATSSGVGVRCASWPYAIPVTKHKANNNRLMVAP